MGELPVYKGRSLRCGCCHAITRLRLHLPKAEWTMAAAGFQLSLKALNAPFDTFSWGDVSAAGRGAGADTSIIGAPQAPHGVWAALCHLPFTIRHLPGIQPWLICPAAQRLINVCKLVIKVKGEGLRKGPTALNHKLALINTASQMPALCLPALSWLIFFRAKPLLL